MIAGSNHIGKHSGKRITGLKRIFTRSPISESTMHYRRKYLKGYRKLKSYILNLAGHDLRLCNYCELFYPLYHFEDSNQYCNTCKEIRKRFIPVMTKRKPDKNKRRLFRPPSFELQHIYQ